MPRTLFEAFGENAPTLPLAVINAEQKKLKDEQAAKEYQVVLPQAETKNFSFSPDIPKPQPDAGGKDNFSSDKSSVSDSIATDIVSNNSLEKSYTIAESANSHDSKTDFSSLIQAAENISSVALALEGALTQEKIHWCGTAKILAEQLQKHVAMLKDIATQ